MVCSIVYDQPLHAWISASLIHSNLIECIASSIVCGNPGRFCRQLSPFRIDFHRHLESPNGWLAPAQSGLCPLVPGHLELICLHVMEVTEGGSVTMQNNRHHTLAFFGDGINTSVQVSLTCVQILGTIQGIQSFASEFPRCPK